MTYDPSCQWDSLVEGHPAIDTSRMTWTHNDRPWRPPQDARTLVRACALRCATSALVRVPHDTTMATSLQEEVAQALPDNKVLNRPTHVVPAEADGAAASQDAWGTQWKGVRRRQ